MVMPQHRQVLGKRRQARYVLRLHVAELLLDPDKAALDKTVTSRNIFLPKQSFILVSSKNLRKRVENAGSSYW